jgi:hypothetical protein
VKTLKQFVTRVLSYLFGTRAVSFSPPHHVSRYSPPQGGPVSYGLGTEVHADDYLSVHPGRHYQEDYLAGFPYKVGIDAYHGWRLPKPERLPVDD